jgi:transcriptional regulator with XRE-family HTH domain
VLFQVPGRTSALPLPASGRYRRASITSEVIAPVPVVAYRRGMSATTTTAFPNRTVGELLREWRERRRLSQLALAMDADVSTRHLSFVETGRSRPSREMLLHLMEQLEVPLRERNVLLLSAGFAPVYPERPLDDPDLSAARDAVSRVLRAHEPFPALAVDRAWNLAVVNRAVSLLTAGLPLALLRAPVNVLRLSLHPEGLATRIVNLPEWRAHLLSRVRRQVAQSGDAGLARLLEELAAMPLPEGATEHTDAGEALTGVAVPLRLRSDDGVLSFLSTTMVFGTPVDVTLSELAVEAFFPADAATAALLPRIFANRVVHDADVDVDMEQSTTP